MLNLQEISTSSCAKDARTEAQNFSTIAQHKTNLGVSKMWRVQLAGLLWGGGVLCCNAGPRGSLDMPTFLCTDVANMLLFTGYRNSCSAMLGSLFSFSFSSGSFFFAYAMRHQGTCVDDTFLLLCLLNESTCCPYVELISFSTIPCSFRFNQ